MSNLLLAFIIMLITAALPAWAQQSRYEEFNQYQEEQAQFDHERQLGLEEYLQQKKLYATEMDARRDDFVANYKKGNKNLPELTPNYEIYQQERLNYQQSLEAARQAFLQQVKGLKKTQDGKQSLSELVEYGLLGSEDQRVDFNKRRRAKGSGMAQSSGGASGGFGGSERFGREPIRDDFPAPPRDEVDSFDEPEPPPPPPAPEFEEGEAIPPPPPPEDVTDF